MFKRNFFGAGPWDAARGIPTVRLAGRPRLGAGANGCVIPGTQEHPVFQYNPTTKVCSVSWIDPGGSYPDCVQAPPGYPGGGHNGWIPPSCASSGEAPPSGDQPSTPPDVPPCCTPTWSPGENRWLVNCSAVDERGITQNYAGDVDGLDHAKWQALCAFAPSGGCPAGQSMIGGQCSPGAIACGDRIVEVVFDDATQSYQPTGRILSEHWNAEHPTESLPLGVHIVNEDDPRCIQASYYPASAPTSTPAPTPTQAPGPASVTPSKAVMPGASVPIVPGPFQSPARQPNIPVSPGLMPSSAPAPIPQKGFSPATIRPSCHSTPYKTHMFPSKTVATRPDQFTERQQWTR